MLSQMEQEHGVTILFAFESGSRAWGFPSPDSDYDVRFVFTRPAESYLSLNPPVDQITLPIVGLLDGHGWDLKKFLHLMGTSNATPFEWLQSTIVYRENEALRQTLWNLSKEYLQKRKLIYHYLGIAIGMLKKEFTEDAVKIKKYFYVLRPILAALWIAEHQSAPPLDFYKLLPLLDNEPAVLAAVHKLLKEKETAKEGQRVAKDLIIDAFVETTLLHCEAATKAFPKDAVDWTNLDSFWRSFLLKNLENDN